MQKSLQRNKKLTRIKHTLTKIVCDINIMSLSFRKRVCPNLLLSGNEKNTVAFV